MFDSPATDARSAVQQICEHSRAQNRAAAAMYTAIDDLYRLRLRENGECAEWAVDTDEEVAGEVAAALRISQGLAMRHLGTARTMHERLPHLAAVFAAGDIDVLLFDALAYRTDLITDSDVLAAVDAELAVKVPRWPTLSRSQLSGRVDRIVARHDRDAVRRRKKRSEDRAIEICNNGDGLSEIRGYLRNIDGIALDERLNALAASVCNADPRTTTQRRADAIDALVAGADRMACECGRADCAAGDKPPASPVVIHVVANQATLDGDTPGLLGPDDLISADLVRELARSAKLMPVIHPGDALAESGYTPSQALADFVRYRDITCRFPGCDRPAARCDLDHTIPYGDGGPTHASNLKCLCRLHHLMKTFVSWHDRQLRDGTIIWTSPSGEVYLSTPGSALLFPGLMQPTGELATAPSDARYCGGDRTAMMPKRRTTRAQNRQRRIADERRQNVDDREVRTQIQRWARALRLAKDGPPPPF